MPQDVVAGAAADADDAGVSQDTETSDPGAGGVDEGERARGDAAKLNAAGDDADDDDEDDYSDVPFKDDAQFKKVVKKLQKRNRQLQKLRPLASRVKDVNLDDVFSKAKSADQMRDALAAHPDLAEQVIQAMSGTRKPAQQKGTEKPKFDRSKLPFSTEDDSGKFFADLVEQFEAQKDTIQKLQSELTGMRESGQRQSRVQVMQTWQSQTKAAAAQVPEWARDMFNDAVYGAFREAESRKVQLEPQKVIKHYLSKLPIGDKAKAAAALSAAQAAGRNSNLPRVPSSSGVPAGARKTGERVADVNRRVRGGAYFPR